MGGRGGGKSRRQGSTSLPRAEQLAVLQSPEVCSSGAPAAGVDARAGGGRAYGHLTSSTHAAAGRSATPGQRGAASDHLLHNLLLAPTAANVLKLPPAGRARRPSQGWRRNKHCCRRLLSRRTLRSSADNNSNNNLRACWGQALGKPGKPAPWRTGSCTGTLVQKQRHAGRQRCQLVMGAHRQQVWQDEAARGLVSMP